MDDRTEGSSSERARDVGRLRARSLVLVGLSGLTLVQPLLGLFGDNAEFFVFKGSSSWVILAFALVVALVLPALVLVPTALAWILRWPRVESVAYVLSVGALSAVVGMELARQAAPESDLASLAAALLVGVGLPTAVVRVPTAAMIGRYLAFGPLVFLALFLFASPVNRLLWAGDVEAVDVEISSPVPVVVVLFDELPLSTLMTRDGEIDDERFPGFAAMAAESTWYRNAASNAPSTTFSVPSLVTGVLPDPSSIPIATEHRRSLFTLLGASYRMEVREQVTALCPTSVCGDRGGSATAVERGAVGELRSLFKDVAVVGLHLALPPSMRDDLPQIDQGWGGFLGQDLESIDGSWTVVGNDPFREFGRQQVDSRAARAQGAQLSDFAGALTPQEQPTLWFVHTVLPHQTWEVSNRGTQYTLSPNMDGVEPGGTWGDDLRPVQQGFQRHVLQTGYADARLAEIVDSLQRSGMWEEAVVVVVADHGVAFAPGHKNRAPDATTVDELYRVPLLVHLPGQTTAVVDDRDAMLIDVVPTLVEVLGIDVDWDFDGRSLLLDDPPRRVRATRAPEGPTEIDPGMEGLWAIVERNTTWVGAGWRGLYAVGPYADDVGRSVEELAPTGRDVVWELDQAAALRELDLSGGFVPLQLTGTTDGATRDGWVLVAVDGVVAGAGFVDEDGRFSALVDEERLHDGSNQVVILAPDGDGGWWSPTLSGGGDVALELDGAVGGTATIDGRTSVPVVASDDAYAVKVDRVVVEDGVLAVSGWSIDREGRRLPDEVVLVGDGEVVPVGFRRVVRTVVASEEGPEFLHSGFELVGTGIDELPAEMAVVSVYDDVVVWTPVDVPEADG